MPLDEMLSNTTTDDIVVTLPFVAAARAASAPALGRFGRLYGSSTVMQDDRKSGSDRGDGFHHR